MTHSSLRTIIYSALFITLVFVATYINIYVPVLMAQGGLVHLGTLVMAMIALKYGPKYGALAGGIGMAMFDLLSIWAIWAPGTLVVRLIAGFVMGSLAASPRGQGMSTRNNLVALLAGGVVIVLGYWIYEGLFLGVGFVPALGSIPGNIIQIVIASMSLALVHSLPSLPVENLKTV